jgi:hypothetical protein
LAILSAQVRVGGVGFPAYKVERSSTKANFVLVDKLKHMPL